MIFCALLLDAGCLAELREEGLCLRDVRVPAKKGTKKEPTERARTHV